MIFIEVQRMQCGKSGRMRAGTMDLAVKFRAAVIQFGNVIRILLNRLVCLIQLAAIHGVRRARGNAARSNVGNLFTVSIDTVRPKVGIGIVNTRLSIALSVKITFATLSVLHGVVKHAIFAGVYR